MGVSKSSAKVFSKVNYSFNTNLSGGFSKFKWKCHFYWLLQSRN